MCKEEADGICENFPLSWNSKFKWFTDNIHFLERVADGKFNNSHGTKKYTHLAKYLVKFPDYLQRVSTHELMLNRHAAPKAQFQLISLMEAQNG